MFGAIDYTFAYWIFFGAVLVLVVFGAKTWFKDRDIVMKWWKWVILAFWYVITMMLLGAPFTIMGEGEVAAGWRMFAFDAVIIIIFGFAVYRLMMIKPKKESE